MSLSLKQIGFRIYNDKEQLNLNFEDFINLIEENDFIVFYYSEHGRRWKVSERE